MKLRVVLLITAFASSVLLGTAEEPHPASARRLEYIRFNPATQTIEWSVSEGTITGEGDFAPKPDAASTYLIHLSAGVKERDGELRPMSPNQSQDAVRVFQALSQLMQNYTDRWEEPPLAEQPSSEEDGSSGEMAPEVHIVRIAEKGGLCAGTPGYPGLRVALSQGE